MHEKLKIAAEHINNFEREIKHSTASLKESNNIPSEMLEGKLVLPVSPSEINGGVCAIDSGFITQSIHGIDIALVKSAAVHFLCKF